MRRCGKKVNKRRSGLNRLGRKGLRRARQFLLRRDEAQFARARGQGRGDDRVDRRRRARQRLGRRAALQPMMEETAPRTGRPAPLTAIGSFGVRSRQRPVSSPASMSSASAGVSSSASDFATTTRGPRARSALDRRAAPR